MTIETFSYVVPSEMRSSPTFGAAKLGADAAAKGKQGIVKVTVGDVFVKPVEQLKAWRNQLRGEGLGFDDKTELAYIPSLGSPTLRKAAAENFTKDYGVAVTDANVAVGNGGKGAMAGATSYFQPGDKVIVSSANWPTNYDIFPAGVELIEVNSNGRGLLSAEQVQEALKLHSDAKGILINTPCNPTGEKYDAAEREAVMKVLADHVATLGEHKAGKAPAFQVIMDAPYDRIVFDGSDLKCGASEAKLMENGWMTVLRSMSKVYGMAGTRVGFAISKHPAVIAQVGKFNENRGGLNGDSQNAAEAALRYGEPFIQSTIADLQGKRDVLVAGVEKCDTLSMKVPQSTIYGWINGEKLKGKTVAAEDDLDGKGYTIDSPDKMMKYLVEMAGVNPVPGTPFYAPNSPFAQSDWNFRFAFSVSVPEIEKACTGLQAAEQKLKDPKARVNGEPGANRKLG